MDSDSDGAAPVFDDIALAAAGADLGDQRQDDVFGRHAGGQLAINVDRHRLEWPQRQRLRRQHMFDLRGADTHCQRTECAMGRGVTVTTDDRHSRLGKTQLRSDDVHDALFDVAHRIEPDAEFFAVTSQCLDLYARHRIGDRLVDVDGGHVVVFSGKRQIGAVHRASGQAQTVEGLRAGDLVHQMQVDIDQVGTRALPGDHNVVVPNLLGHGARHNHLDSLDLSMRDASISL